jgi:hypothetical protein
MAALAHEREDEFLQAFNQFIGKFEMFDLAFAQFLDCKAEIENSIRQFTTEASKCARDIHRLRINDVMKRFVTERLYPSLVSRWGAERREQFSRPLVDVLESHCRVVLGIAKSTNAVDKTEPICERSVEQ